MGDKVSNALQEVAMSKTASGIAVAGSVVGLTVSEWAALLTAVFVLMQIVVLSPKFFGQLRDYWTRFKKWRASKRG